MEGVNDTLKFTENKLQLRVPFCIYADFEAFSKDVETCYPDPNKSSITCNTKFEACSYGYQVICSDERYTKSPVIYRGLNAVQHFLESLHEEELNIKEILRKNCPMIMTDVDKEHFKKQNQCFLCENFFSPETGKVRDHCHISGKYRGAACIACNLNFKPPTFIPVVFHNLKNFDLHLLIHGIGMRKKDISCIPHNMERYLSLSLGNLRFIDSLQFLNASLEELVENLASDGFKPFLLLQKEYQDPAQTHLMKRKGVYPYNYVTFFSKYEEKKLQPKIAFYNTLTKTHITNDEYMHAQQVWSTFNLKNLGEYHDIYLKSDVLLLADVFENFRDLTMKTYHLDPAHFFSCPQLSWQSALKFTKCKLKLLSDPTQYLFFEEGIRGGVSAITKRYAKANNKDLQEDYNPQLPSNYLLYLDC